MIRIIGFYMYLHHILQAHYHPPKDHTISYLPLYFASQAIELLKFCFFPSSVINTHCNCNIIFNKQF